MNQPLAPLQRLRWGGRRVRVEPREEGGRAVRGGVLHTASVRERLEVPVSVCTMQPRRPFSWKACSRGLRFISDLAWLEQRLSVLAADEKDVSMKMPRAICACRRHPWFKQACCVRCFLHVEGE